MTHNNGLAQDDPHQPKDVMTTKNTELLDVSPLPQDRDLKIGLSISGGGYRATSFSLGTLSYLNHLQYRNKPLLHHVIGLSTVSGGSITGITYQQWNKAGAPFIDYFQWLFNQITEEDIIERSINNYISDPKKNSLIEGFASTYAEKLLPYNNIREEHNKSDREDETKKHHLGLSKGDITSYTNNKNRKFYSIIPARTNENDKNLNELELQNENANPDNFNVNETVYDINKYPQENGVLDTHILYNCINATDFNSGSPFRFISQCDWEPDILTAFNIEDWVDNDKNLTSDDLKVRRSFYSGNSVYTLDKNIRRIPLNVALAASSCFPGGFEPIILHFKNYCSQAQKFRNPNFYITKITYTEMETTKVENSVLQTTVTQSEETLNAKKKEEIKNGKNKEGEEEVEEKDYRTELSLSLMDGGIVDNQGIDSILFFHKKVKLDLVMVVDSASPGIDKYREAREVDIPVIGNLSMNTITFLITLVNILSIGGLVWSFYAHNVYTFLFTILTTIFTTINIALIVGRSKAKKLISQANLLASTFKPLGTLRPNSIKQILLNRLASFNLLVGTVFMKHLRTKNIESLEVTANLKNRFIINGIYQLKYINRDEEFLAMKNISIPDVEINGLKLAPINFKIKHLSNKAYNMGTSLWVEHSHKGKKLIRDVITVGQITTCANLIQLLYNNGDTENPMFAKLTQDWNKFMYDPYWLFKELHNDYLKPKYQRQKEYVEKKNKDKKAQLENLKNKNTSPTEQSPAAM